MLDVQNPDIKVDEIMQRIQEKVRLRREQPVPRQVGMGTPVSADSLIFNQLLGQARDTAQVGVSVPPMSRTHGLKRKLAELNEKLSHAVAPAVHLAAPKPPPTTPNS